MDFPSFLLPMKKLCSCNGCNANSCPNPYIVFPTDDKCTQRPLAGRLAWLLLQSSARADLGGDCAMIVMMVVEKMMLVMMVMMVMMVMISMIVMIVMMVMMG